MITRGARENRAPDGQRAAAEYVVHGEYIADDAGLPPARGPRYVLPVACSSSCATSASRA